MSALALPHGVHRNVAHETYHTRELGMVSKHALDLVRRSPAHYKAWLDGQDEEPTPALVFGSAFHCALLEPDNFARAYAVAPDFGDCRKTENKARRDAWRAANEGRTQISSDDDATIRGMLASVRAHPLAGRIVVDGEAELTVRWRDPATGLECKARADYYRKAHRMLVDVKSALDASADEFRRAIANRRYHVQDAHYRASFNAVGEAVEHFVFVVVEKTPPYAVAVYALDASSVARGHAQVRADMETLARCAEKNDWPGYPVEIQTLELPPWAA